MILRRSAIGLALVVVTTGCGADDRKNVGQPIVAPPQKTSTIAAIKVVFGNPPHFDLLTFSDDGSHVRSVVRVPADGIQRLSSPAWSPDGKRIYFVGTVGERDSGHSIYYESELFSVSADGSDLRRLTSSRDVVGVAPSPDGQSLVVARQEYPGGVFDYRTRIWLMTSEGKDARPLLDSIKGQVDIPGSWSPDGRIIAFTRCQMALPNRRGRTENTCGVHVVSTDGSGLRKLTARSSWPAFSPDGKRIAFVSDRDESGVHQTGSDEEDFANELYVMNADGSHQLRMTKSDGLDESTPSWSPDGDWIVFAREGPASFMNQVMLARGDGSCARALIGDGRGSQGDVSHEAPAWRPGRVVGRPAAACR